MLKLDQVSKSFGRRPVLGPLSFALAPGERLAVLGPSGCGKTTLLRIVAGLERPDSGAVSLGGEVASAPRILMPPCERGIGFVFQTPALWPHMTVEENLEFVLPGLAPLERNLRARQLLKSVRLEEFAERPPDELSGGEQQRVAILRALAPTPRLLLLDEPLSHLDPENALLLLELIKRGAEAAGAAVILVTHDHEQAESFTGRILRLRSDGTPA